MADFESVVVNGTSEQLQKLLNSEAYSIQNMNQYGINKAGFLSFQQASSNSEDDVINILPYLTEKNNESRAEYGILEFSASTDRAPVLLKGIKDGIEESDAATVRQVNKIKANENSVLYAPQELTEEEKSQARANIGAMQNGVADTNLDMQRHGINNASHIILSKKLEVEGEDVYTAFEMSCGSTVDGHGYAEFSDINGDPVRITGVADGTTDSDAATCGQLWDLNSRSEHIANRVTTIDENSDDEHYPSAKAVFDALATGGGSAGGDFPTFEKIIGVEEYNQIAKAVEVSTVEELKAYNGNAILKGYRQKSLTTNEENVKYNILKIPVQPGDVIRDKLATWWRPPSNHTGWPYAFFYDAEGNAISYTSIYYDGITSPDVSPNYLDIRENGITAPNGCAYVLLNIYYVYVYGSNYADATNGLTANIITKNADPNLTVFDGSAILPDYVAVGDGNSETYYKATDDVRIPRYEDALGDIETALDSIIATQESLIGGGV